MIVVLQKVIYHTSILSQEYVIFMRNMRLFYLLDILMCAKILIFRKCFWVQQVKELSFFIILLPVSVAR